MRSAKTTRIWVATCVALCLLFAQMATAAYVCPHLLGSAVPTPGYMQAVATGCDAMHPSQMDNAQPNLCKAHCESGQQAHESKSSADVQLPALEGVWLLVSVLPFETVLTSQAAPLTYLSARPPGSPPLYLAHQVFRL